MRAPAVSFAARPGRRSSDSVRRPCLRASGSCGCHTHQRRGRSAAPRHRLGGKLALHRLKQRGIENRLMLPVVDLTAIDHLADIEAVLKKIRERANTKTAAADRAPVR